MRSLIIIPILLALASASFSATVTNIAPTTAVNSGLTRISVTGTGLICDPCGCPPGNMCPSADIQVSLTRNGQTIYGGYTYVLPLTPVVVSTTLPILGATPGVYDLVVTSLSNRFDVVVVPSAFEILQAVEVHGIQPVSSINDAVAALTITGSHFAPGASARLTKAGEPILTGSSPVVAGDGSAMTALFDLVGRSSGAWNVTVENPDGVFATLVDGFTVLSRPAPGSVSPASAPDDGALTITIIGAGFEPGATVQLARGPESIPGTGTEVLDAATVRTTVDLLDRSTGAWDVGVTNPSGLDGVLAGAFAVTPKLRLSSVSPAFAADGAPVALTLQGRHFEAGTTTSLRRSGQADITGTPGIPAPDGTSLVAEFDVVGRPAGTWDVFARNPNGQEAFLPAAFALHGMPHPTAVSPASGYDDRAILITLTGSNFTDGTSARLVRGGHPPVPVAGPQIAPDGTSLTGSLDLTDQETGLWEVEVTNPGGGASSLTGAFEILPRFRVLSTTPGSAPPGGSLPLTIIGRWFEAGASAHLSRPGQADRVGQSATVAPDGRSLTADFDLGGAALGPWDVVVTQPGGTAASLPGGFTVAHPVPDSPLTLLWGACNRALPPGREDVVFDCTPGGRARLFGMFQPSVTVPDVVAISGALDLFVDEAGLPPFWHIESGGCNANAIAIVDDRDESVCPAASHATVYGASGQITDAFVTAYLPGASGPNAARLLWAIVRASTDPVTLDAGTNYFGFEMDFDVADVVCAGCDAGVSVHWLWATFESPMAGSGDETLELVLEGNGQYPSVATINGGAGGVVPVRLARFDAEPREDGVEVSWGFTASGEFTSVDVQRRSGSEWMSLAAMPVGDGTTSLVDRDVVAGRTYEYRLVATRRVGGTQTFGPIVATMPGATGVAPGLHAIAPNPSPGRTTFEYVLAREGNVRIRIVDVQGRERVSLVSARMPAGRHVAEWDGRIGRAPAPAGLYFVRCAIDGRETVRRMTLAR